MGCNGMASSFFPPNFLFQMQTPYDHHHPHEEDSCRHLSSSIPALPQDYHGVGTFLGKRSMSLQSGMDQKMNEEMINGEDDLSDDCSQLGEKKRRLSMDQVRTLEKNFELGNKLETDRKLQLARTLGLQPRQIAIWFQNRRARWKTKQLERDYDVLKKQFESVRSENDALQAHNKKLQAEIMALNGREISTEPINLNKETEVSCSYRSSDNSSVINLEISRTSQLQNHESTMTSTANHSMSFFPIRPHHLMASQLFQRQELQFPKVESHGGEETLYNVFCNLDDQPAGFWNSWQEQQSFHSGQHT